MIIWQAKRAFEFSGAKTSRISLSALLAGSRLSNPFVTSTKQVPQTPVRQPKRTGLLEEFKTRLGLLPLST